MVCMRRLILPRSYVSYPYVDEVKYQVTVAQYDMVKFYSILWKMFLAYFVTAALHAYYDVRTHGAILLCLFALILLHDLIPTYSSFCLC